MIQVANSTTRITNYKIIRVPMTKDYLSEIDQNIYKNRYVFDCYSVIILCCRYTKKQNCKQMTISILHKILKRKKKNVSHAYNARISKFLTNKIVRSKKIQ